VGLTRTPQVGDSQQQPGGAAAAIRGAAAAASSVAPNRRKAGLTMRGSVSSGVKAGIFWRASFGVFFLQKDQTCFVFLGCAKSFGSGVYVLPSSPRCTCTYRRQFDKKKSKYLPKAWGILRRKKQQQNYVAAGKRKERLGVHDVTTRKNNFAIGANFKVCVVCLELAIKAR
jgi:hypothetical protein